jgi:hypothetical protein
MRLFLFCATCLPWHMNMRLFSLMRTLLALHLNTPVATVAARWEQRELRMMTIHRRLLILHHNILKGHCRLASCLHDTCICHSTSSGCPLFPRDKRRQQRVEQSGIFLRDTCGSKTMHTAFSRACTFPCAAPFEYGSRMQHDPHLSNANHVTRIKSACAWMRSDGKYPSLINLPNSGSAWTVNGLTLQLARRQQLTPKRQIRQALDLVRPQSRSTRLAAALLSDRTPLTTVMAERAQKERDIEQERYAPITQLESE